MAKSADFSALARAHTAWFADLEASRGLSATVALGERARQFAGELLAAGGDGLLVAETLSRLNDALTARVIQLVVASHRLPAADWSWLAFGSEGRHEQTFASDQDNGLVFLAADAREAEALRPLFLDFAQDVNQRLADCGFGLCPGNIMAGNPQWCLSLDEWCEQFRSWVRTPHPEALLNASIFFDLRTLAGDHTLLERMQRCIHALVVDASVFLHLMASNALSVQVPLSFLGEVQVEGGKSLEAFDVKKFGTRLFVDVARIFALAQGVTEADTRSRLELAGRASGLKAEEISAMLAAFSQLIRLRFLQHGTESNGEEKASETGVWHEVDRVILREALRQARRLQQRLKLNYSL